MEENRFSLGLPCPKCGEGELIISPTGEFMKERGRIMAKVKVECSNCTYKDEQWVDIDIESWIQFLYEEEFLRHVSDGSKLLRVYFSIGERKWVIEEVESCERYFSTNNFKELKKEVIKNYYLLKMVNGKEWLEGGKK